MVTKIEIKNIEELKDSQRTEDLDMNYVIVNKKDRNVKNCCELVDTEDCIGAQHVFRIRPYTFDYLRAILPFFEIVVFSKMHHKIIE